MEEVKLGTGSERAAFDVFQPEWHREQACVVD